MTIQPSAWHPVTQNHAHSKLNRAKELRKRMTPAERRLWHALKTNQLGGLHFRRQQVILGFIVDFCCHRLRLVIELDGSVHDTIEEYDKEREAALIGLGMFVLRFQNNEVFHDLNAVLNPIAQLASNQDKANPTQ